MTHLTDWTWRYWLPVPIYPYGQRRTLRQEIIPDQLWTFDQIQGIFYVVVPIRMTVVKLEAGGLLVYAPVAPTPECLRLMQELVDCHGEVKYIILPTVSGGRAQGVCRPVCPPLYQRSGVHCAAPVELSAESAAELAGVSDAARAGAAGPKRRSAVCG